MESTLLRFNGVTWAVSTLGEQALLLKPQLKEPLSAIHSAFQQLSSAPVLGIIDLVPAYESLAVFYDETLLTETDLLKELSALPVLRESDKAHSIHNIEVDYSIEADWERVLSICKLMKEEVIALHTKKFYTVAMFGFVPGFLFLDGLDKRLHIPRLSSPRTRVSAGSVAIGGDQTGIYSIESPGGWNIIGKIYTPFFDVNKEPPSAIKPGDKLRFIAKKE